MTKITGFDTYDVRFPTSRTLAGSDAMNPAPDYSAAYVVIRTDAPDPALAGHGFAFTIGPGNDVQLAAKFDPDKIKKLVDPYDKTQDLGARVRSYLHRNCSQCHVEAGGGNAAMELEFTKTIPEMNIINVKPQHDTFGIKDAKIIAPGHPERSVMLHRISQRDKGHMPPLATRVVDQQMVEAMREWIRTMPKDAGVKKDAK